MLTVLVVVCALLAFAVCELFLLRLRLTWAHEREKALFDLLRTYQRITAVVAAPAAPFDPEATQDREVQP